MDDLTKILNEVRLTRDELAHFLSKTNDGVEAFAHFVSAQHSGRAQAYRLIKIGLIEKTVYFEENT